MHTHALEPQPHEIMDYLSLSEVTRLCALSHEEAAELVDFGAILIEHVARGERYVSLSQVVALQKACKLYRDYDVDLFCVVISMDFMRQIEKLEGQLALLTALTPGVVLS
jgi:hypothetical protein